MVVAAFPIAKLGALLIRQISKPIANIVKERAKTHPFFRKYVCLPPAQFYNWCEIQSKMWVLNLGKPVSVPILNETMAIELGANLVGEGLIFTIAAAILLSEYNRSSRKETAKELEKTLEMESLVSKIHELYIQTETQAAQIRELTRTTASLENRAVTKPWTKPPLSVSPETKRAPPPPSPQISHSSELPTNNISSVNMEGNDQGLPRIVYKSNIDLDRIAVASRSRLLQAVLIVEREFWLHPPQPRADGILTQALNYINKEVYRIPITA